MHKKPWEPVEASVRRLRELSSRPRVGRNVAVEVLPALGHAVIDPETGWVSRAGLDRMVELALAAGTGRAGLVWHLRR